ncbi:DUF6270 domain-containing protein [Ignatzschineria rhizosphaerae]|uniref:DUF6270 domain-containing protein n=1 Tax=Ignatzschineria rhizosphaerae TaxID=2923279 RepID=A0ABY3X3K9_9GAMM|nr:DUF6270 domain-containing protein [Ignatzschineria rhizosphaerae]UNM97467.1 DUF6270 domain-containing protein [Ignatzschineria rhizosphaerae]
MKVFISGSCVSRDAFTPNNIDLFENVEYVARYSLARLAYPAFSQIDADNKQFIENVPSPFQRKTLLREWGNSLLDLILNSDFDYLVIDCIDERFGLIELTPELYVTNSDEFHKSRLINIRDAKKIMPDEDIFLLHWEEGLKKIIEVAGENKIIINNVFFSKETDQGLGFPNSSPSRIEYCNDFLNSLYEIARKYLPEKQFVNYPENIFVGSCNHKWGLAPFHYIEDVYQYFLFFLQKVGSERW